MTSKLRISDHLVKKLQDKKNTLTLSNSSLMSKPTITAILNDICFNYKLEDEEDAMTILAVFCQQGATSSKCSGNMTYTFDNVIYKLSDIRKIFQKHNAKNGIRKFARTYATTFYEICELLQIPGNMYQKVKRLHPSFNFKEKDKYWVSDFQAYNENAPSEIRELIIKSFPKNRK